MAWTDAEKVEYYEWLITLSLIAWVLFLVWRDIRKAKKTGKF